MTPILLVLLARMNVIMASFVASLSPSRRVVATRGITFIEYALLAAIAVVLAVIFRNALTTMFTGVLNDVRDALAT